MKNLYILICMLCCFCSSFAQDYYGQLVTNSHDTLNVQIRTKAIIENNKIVDLQEGVTAVSNNIVTEYTPKDLISFRVKINNKNFYFESVDGVFFAQALYTTGKVKLYKTLQMFGNAMSRGLLRVYIIKKPGQVALSKMVAKGLSRLITKDESLPPFEDCKAATEKLINDEVKIKDEQALIEFVKYYEDNCFSK